MTTLRVAAWASGAVAVVAGDEDESGEDARSTATGSSWTTPAGRLDVCSGNRLASPLPERHAWGRGRRWDWWPSTARRGGRPGTSHPSGVERGGRSLGRPRGAGWRTTRRATGCLPGRRLFGCRPVCDRVVDLGVRPEYARRVTAPSATAVRPIDGGRYRSRGARRTRSQACQRRGRHDVTSSGSGVALATQGLAKRYGSRVALDGLDLRVPDGRRLRVPGSQRRRQDDDDADPHRAHPRPTRAASSCSAGRSGAATAGACSRSGR